MTDVNRRQFLQGAAALGVASVAPLVGCVPGGGIPQTNEEHRVVIIGSGFGGSVSALRLAQAGVPVVVLERGTSWPTGPNADTFPTAATIDGRALWYESNPQLWGRPLLVENYAGLLETVAGENMSVVVPAGVGGGSLIYQGMSLQPSEAVFNTILPEQLDYTQMDSVYYPRVAQMLGLQTAPDDIINSPTYLPARIFARNAQRAGYSYEKIPMPIDWSYAQRELRGEMKASYTNGDCALGVNNGGKRSLDVTYLAAAQATGRCQIKSLHVVRDIAQATSGKWQISVDRINVNGVLQEKKTITCGTLIMAAGSMHTPRLLMRAQGRGTIRDLPDSLGTNWGSNGDRIFTWNNQEFPAVQGGPVVYGSMEWDDPTRANTLLQASLPPTGTDTNMTMLVGMAVSTDRGRFVYNSATGDAKLRWTPLGDSVAHQRVIERANALVKPEGTVTDTYTLGASTWHPIGGAAMGSVCDLQGRVVGKRGLYVLDGALIPGSTGACNPSMTIAAVAERAMDIITRQDIGTII